MKTNLLAGCIAVLTCVLSVAAIHMIGDDRAAQGAPAPGGAGKPGDLPAGVIARLGARRGQTLADSVAAVNAVAFSADGKTLATTDGYNGGITLWDVDSGKKLRHFTIREPETFLLPFPRAFA